MRKSKSFLLIESVVLIAMVVFVSTSLAVSYGVQLSNLKDNYRYMVKQRQKLEAQYEN